MTTYKRVAGNLIVETTGATDTVTFNGPTANAATVVINGDLTVSGNTSLSGNLSGTSISNGTTSIAIPTASGNATVSVGGVSNVAVFSSTGQLVNGTVSATGNVAGNFFIGNGSALTGITGLANLSGNLSGNLAGNGFGALNFSFVSATGNVQGGNISTVGQVSATGNVTGNFFIGNGSQLTGITGTGGQGLTGTQGTTGAGFSGITSTSTATPASTGTITLTTNAQGAFVTGDRVRAVNTVSNYFEGTVTITGGTTFAIAADFNEGTTAASSWTLTITGVRGVQGTQGVQGAQGTQGIQGVQGAQGVQAAQGTQGTQGTQGIQGVQGAQGVQAAQGIQGVQGTQGTQGIQGVQGTQGTQGIQGVQGAQGTQGIQGIQGITGPSTTINATDNTSTTALYPVMVGASGSNQTANVTIGKFVFNAATGNLTATGNVITNGLLSVNSGNSSGTVIVNAGANTVGNIGSTTNYFGSAHVTALRALYADLSENYAADAYYAPGTVLSFGGNQEVTLSTVAADTRVAGVVSTNPSYQMNSGIESEHIAAVALQGRVPTQVIGPVCKGDMMISAGNGRAQACAAPAMGTVIGKALQNLDQETGIIEVVVGRL